VLKHKSDFMNTIPLHAFKNLTTLSITLLTSSGDWDDLDQIALDRSYPGKFSSWLSRCDNLENLLIKFECGGMSTSSYDLSLVVQSLLGSPTQSAALPCPRLKSFAMSGHAYFPAVFLRFMLERTASPKQIKEAGFNPKDYRQISERTETFKVDFNLRLLQKVTDGYEFEFCDIECAGWEEFYDKYSVFYIAEDEDVITELGRLPENKRLDFMYKRLKMLRKKCKTRVAMMPGSEEANNSMGPFGNPYIENPMNPMMMGNLAKAFEEMFGLDGLYDDDEEDYDDDDGEDGEEDEEDDDGSDEEGNGSAGWETDDSVD